MRERNHSLDLFKGLLVVAMVYCHWLQFFGNPALYPIEQPIMDLINLAVFPSFVFVFGRTHCAAYLSKPLRAVWPRMLLSTLKSLLAFYLSGCAYLILCEGEPFCARTLRGVFTLKSIPGWSEFLIAFALFGLLAFLLFAPLKKLLEHRAAFFCVCGALFLTALLPYEGARDTRLQLLIGGTDFACFPIVPYMPYFLLGLYVQKRGFEGGVPRWVIGACALSAYGVACTLTRGWPTRFPPSLGFTTMAAVFVLALSGLSAALVRTGAWTRPIRAMGARSLWYLLASNLAIFAAKHTGLLPVYTRSGKFPFNLSVASPLGAAFWTAALLVIIGFLASLAGTAKSPEKAMKAASGK